MAKGKKATKPVEKDESYLDFLKMGGAKIGDDEGEKKTEPSQADQISGLMDTIKGLSSTVDNLQLQVAQGARTPVQAPVVPIEPKLKEVSFKGLPDQTEDPEGFATGLNTRMTETLRDNMRAMGEFEAAKASHTAHGAQQTEQLWDDFQTKYMDKLEKGLPEGVDATPYVEVVAKKVVAKAGKRGLDVNAYMYQGSFMADVYEEADKVLSPFREKEEGEGKGEKTSTLTGSTETSETNRTGGIFGSSGAEGGGGEEEPDKNSLISDLQEVQVKTGFF